MRLLAKIRLFRGIFLYKVFKLFLADYSGMQAARQWPLDYYQETDDAFSKQLKECIWKRAIKGKNFSPTENKLQ